MNSILDEILTRKKKDVEAAKKLRAPDLIKSLAREAKKPSNLYDSLMPGQNGAVTIIAECKKQSPSKGLISDNYQPTELASRYEQGGAAAISVLTDEPYFGGTRDDLRRVCERVSIPVIRKDFIIDDYQIWEARALGASSFLLLAGTLDFPGLQYFIELGRELGMEPLVESHNQEQLNIALKTDAKILGINNRNLNDFSVSLEQSQSLTQAVLEDRTERLLVCESGIKSLDDIIVMQKSGFQSFLIGETLVRSDDPESLIRQFSMGSSACH